MDPPFSMWLLHWKCFLVLPAVFFRREALGDRLLDERFQFAVDWELRLRLAYSSGFHRLGRTGIRLDTWYQRLGAFHELALRLSGVPAMMRLTGDMAFRGTPRPPLWRA